MDSLQILTNHINCIKGQIRLKIIDEIVIGAEIKLLNKTLSDLETTFEEMRRAENKCST